MTLLELQVTQVQDKWRMIELPPLYNIPKWLVSTSRKLDRRKFLQSVNIFAILHHSYSFRVHPDLFLFFCPGIRPFQGYLVFKRPNLYQNRLTLVPPKWHLEEEREDDGYANQKMCADVIFVQSHINFPCIWKGRSVRESSTVVFETTTSGPLRAKSQMSKLKKFVKKTGTYRAKRCIRSNFSNVVIHRFLRAKFADLLIYSPPSIGKNLHKWTLSFVK